MINYHERYSEAVQKVVDLSAELYNKGVSNTPEVMRLTKEIEALLKRIQVLTEIVQANIEHPKTEPWVKHLYESDYEENEGILYYSRVIFFTMEAANKFIAEGRKFSDDKANMTFLDVKLPIAHHHYIGVPLIYNHDDGSLVIEDLDE